MNNHKIGALYDELYGYLFTLIKGRLYRGCLEDVVYDCLNEVFIIALRKKDDASFQENPKKWLVVTAKHVVDNYNRKHLNRIQNHHAEYDLSLRSDGTNMLEDLAFKIAVEENVLDTVKKELSADDRVLYIMRYEERKDIDAIAKELGMKRGTVFTRITRVKRKMEKLIRKYVGE